MHKLTPAFILEQVAGSQSSGQFDAVVLFVDTSGFTPLTARLSAYGRDGAEILAEILHAVFEPLVEAVYAHGGFIAGFAGDAFKAIFQGMTPESYLQALAAAEEIRTHMANHPTHNRRHGTFDFSVRMSIADGTVTWAVWSGHEDEAEQSSGYTFAGSAIDQAVQGEDHADGGELVITEQLYAAIQAIPALTIRGEPLMAAARGYVRVEQGPTQLSEPPSIDPPAAAIESIATRFYPLSLLNMRTQGEFRPVYSVFLNVQQLPAPEAEDNFLPVFFQLLHQYGGYLCRIGRIGASDTGGTFLLFWGAPISYENDLNRALSFLLELQSKLNVPLRAGITHAVVYAGFIGSTRREEYTCYGASVNQAARQMVIANWNQVLVDAATARRGQAEFQITEAGYYSLKGVTDEQPLFALQRHQERIDATIYHDDFVGRRSELDQLLNAVQSILTEDSSGLLLIRGEAGIGKSRLAHEAFNLAQQRNLVGPMQLLRCQTDEILRESLNPFRYFLRHYFDQTPNAGQAANAAKFTAKLDALIARTTDPTTSQELNRTRSCLGALVNLHWPDSLYEQLEPQLRFENTLVALRTLFVAECRQQPIFLLLEDIHWFDEDSWTFLKQLLNAATTYPLLVVTTARLSPHPEQTIPLEEELIDLEIVLMPLSTAEVGAMAAQKLGGAVSPELAALLVQRADGNPFFAEQLLHYLHERQLLVPADDGWRLLEGTASNTASPDEVSPDNVLPDDVQTVLVARLDRLAQEVKQVVQTAAVLGREFSVRILSQMLQSDLVLEQKVQSAQDAAIWSALNELRYLFRHALLRDAAYAMQLQAQLRALHSAAAAAIETLYHDQLTPYYSDLVYHYHLAGMAEEERTFAILAGEQAAAQFANRDAMGYLQRALALTPEQDRETHFALLTTCERVNKLLGDTTAQLDNLVAMQALAEAMDEPARQAEVQLVYAEYYTSISDYPAAVEAAHTAITLAEQAGDLRLQSEGYQRSGRALWPQANYRAAQRAAENALRLAQRAALPTQEADALVVLGITLWFLGDYSSAQQRLQESLPIYEIIGQPFTQKSALVNLALVAQIVGDDQNALTHFEQALGLAREMGARQDEAAILSVMAGSYHKVGEYELALRIQHETRPIFAEVNDRFGEIVAATNIGLITTELGDYNTARTHLEQALTLSQAIGSRAQECGILAALSEIDLLEGKLAAASQRAHDAVAIGTEAGFQDGEANALLVHGNVFLALNQPDAAVPLLQQALTIRRALKEQHRSTEIWAAMAQVAIHQDDWPQALVHVQAILDYLATDSLNSIPSRFQIYLTCCQVLLYRQDDRAHDLLVSTHQQLQNRAANIQNSTLRISYLTNVAAHRTIIELYQRNHGGVARP